MAFALSFASINSSRCSQTIITSWNQSLHEYHVSQHLAHPFQ